jgi:hypothetical protein
MGEITSLPDDEDEFQYPKYSDVGQIIVEILGPCPNYTWELGRYACGEGSTFYISEGMGVDYWVHEHSDEIPGPGIWTFVNVHGYYHRGDGWEIDDDEEWQYDEVRAATAEEIKEL